MSEWTQNIFGIWLPKPEPSDRIEIKHQYGFEIRRDGKVMVRKDGQEREADWKEAAHIKNRVFEVLGPELAAQAGLEPE